MNINGYLYLTRPNSAYCALLKQKNDYTYPIMNINGILLDVPRPTSTYLDTNEAYEY